MLSFVSWGESCSYCCCFSITSQISSRFSKSLFLNSFKALELFEILILPLAFWGGIFSIGWTNQGFEPCLFVAFLELFWDLHYSHLTFWNNFHKGTYLSNKHFVLSMVCVVVPCALYRNRVCIKHFNTTFIPYFVERLYKNFSYPYHIWSFCYILIWLM